MNYFLNFLSKLFQPLDSGVFQLLQTFRRGFLNLLREPGSLKQVEAQYSQNHNHQQHLAHVAKIANQAHHGAAEEVSSSAEHKNPEKTASQRERKKSHVEQSRA